MRYFLLLHCNTAMVGPPKAFCNDKSGREGEGPPPAAVAVWESNLGVALMMPARVVVMYVY